MKESVMPLSNLSVGLLASAARRYVCLVVLAGMAALALTSAAAASQREVLVISTEKPLGPALGSFSTSGAFSDSGVLVTERLIFSAVPSPFGVVSHLVLRFEGQQGTFTVETQIMETVTDDVNVFADEGTWVILDGSGAYATLRGTGDVEGTVDDAANLVTRVFTGLVHFK
jgi:hypothetical protein